MALFLDGWGSAYSNLPQQIPRATLLEVVEGGRQSSTLYRDATDTWLLLAMPLNIPNADAVLVGAYDVSDVFASRDAQLTAWLVAAVAVLAAEAVLTWLGITPDAPPWIPTTRSAL